MWFHVPPNKTCTTHNNRIIPVITIVYLLTAKLPITMGKSVISDITTDAKSTSTGSTSATSFSSSSGGRQRRKWSHNNKPAIMNTVTFKGANLELTKKVFVIVPSQASKYDKAYKALITYFGSKFDHRVSRAFEQKDSDVGRKMLIFPSAPMINKVVQVATEG